MVWESSDQLNERRDKRIEELLDECKTPREFYERYLELQREFDRELLAKTRKTEPVIYGE